MPSDLTLYQVEDELLALMNTEDLVEEEQHAAILEAIAKTTGEAVEKRDKVAAFLRHIEHQITGVDAEIGRLQALKKRWQAGKERFEKYVIGVIEAFVEQPKYGPKKLEGRLSVLSLAKNPDSVVITGAVPIVYCDVRMKITGTQFQALVEQMKSYGMDTKLLFDSRELTPRKADIAKALKAGIEVPGARLESDKVRLVVK